MTKDNPYEGLRALLDLTDKLEQENARLREALEKAISYLDVDNLTMQSVERELKEALKEQP